MLFQDLTADEVVISRYNEWRNQRETVKIILLFLEVGTCAAIIAAQACGATILLAIALAPQLF